MEYKDEILTIKQFAGKYPWPGENALRAMIARARKNENSYKGAFLKRGRRVLIDSGEFFSILKKEQEYSEK